MATKKKTGPRVLFLDIETKPLLAYVWDIWNVNVSLNQIAKDWSILSFSAKWMDDPASKIIYQDLRRSKDIDDDRPLLDSLWALLDEADIVVTQNGIKFDKRKIYARFLQHGFKPPSPFVMADTYVIAKRLFGFTSNKLEHMTDKVNRKYKKLKHEKFAGFELWKECMAGNQSAWREMEKYNKYDVLALEELYVKMRPWSSAPNFGLYRDDFKQVCACGSKDFERRGFHYTSVAKYQRFRCTECGSWTRGTENLVPKEKRGRLHRSVPK